MLLSCAIGLRRPAEAIIAYATLAAWSVLLLALPLLHPDDESGGGLWIALMFVLLGLAAYALPVALPDRGRLQTPLAVRRPGGRRDRKRCVLRKATVRAGDRLTAACPPHRQRGGRRRRVPAACSMRRAAAVSTSQAIARAAAAGALTSRRKEKQVSRRKRLDCVTQR